MPEQQAEKVPELISALRGIDEQLQYYADLNLQLGKIGHKIVDTTKADPALLKEGQPRPSGILSDLQNAHAFLSTQNTILQDTINKLNGLI